MLQLLIVSALQVPAYRSECSCIVILESKVVATAPIVLYPVELIVGLWIEQDDVGYILHYLLQAKARALEVVLC